VVAHLWLNRCGLVLPRHDRKGTRFAFWPRELVYDLGMNPRRLRALCILVAACRSPTPPSAVPDATTEGTDAAPPSLPAPSLRPAPVADAGAAKSAAVSGQPCLNRDAAGDARCSGAKPHFFVWDAHACAIAKETVSEVQKRCEAIGPHRGMNITNWCCP